MTLTDVLNHFKARPSDLADMLGVTRGAVSQWKDGIPDARQWQIEAITKGALKASPTRYERAKAA